MPSRILSCVARYANRQFYSRVFVEPTSSRIAQNLCCRRLVTQLSPTTSLLRSEGSDNEVYLIGTAHVSGESANEVSDLIDLVQPQTVFVELDPPRAARLIHENQDKFEEQLQQAVASLTKNLPVQVLGPNETLIGDYIRAFYKTMKKYGLVPGIDMLSAIKAGQRVEANLFYGDRDANDTLRELTATLNPPMFLKGMTTPIPDELQKSFRQAMSSGGFENLGDRVEQIKTREYAQQMTDWMQRAFPETAAVLIHKRDMHMAQNLRKHCNAGKVVAVVGIAHMDGIEREWSRLGKERSS